MSNSQDQDEQASQSTITEQKKTNKLLKLTKRASKIAGDIAFGNAYDNVQFLHHPQMPQVPPHIYNTKSTNSDNTNILQEYTNRLQNLINATQIQCMHSYLDYLKFFLNYMDESDPNDIFDYSITRNSLWNQTIARQLNKILRILDSYTGSGLFSDQASVQSESESASAISTVASVPTSASASASVSASPSTPASAVASISSKKTTPPQLHPLPSLDEINEVTFQDQRVTLLLLWNNQIFNKLSNEFNILTELLKHHPPGSDLCIVTTNKLKPYNYPKSSPLATLFKYHTLPSQLELIDGWQLRHDFPDFKTNLISVTDKFQVILDLRNAGHLSTDILEATPHFNDFAFLDSNFIDSKFDANEKTFIENYSSFTTPSVVTVPLDTQSQNLIYSPDFSRLVNNKDDVINAIQEFDRLLKPKGSLLITLFDIISFKNISSGNHDCSLSEYVQIYLNFQISKFSNLPNISEFLINHLNSPTSSFINVQFVKLGIPVIDYRDTEDSEHNNDNSMNNPKSSTTSKELPSIADNPIASMYSMFSSYVEYLRIQQIFNLQYILNASETSHLTPDMVSILKIWIDWKLHGFESTLVKSAILERLNTHVSVDGYDAELSVRILATRLTGNPNTNVYLNKRAYSLSDFYDSYQSDFHDGSTAGIDSLTLITAIKKG